MKFLFIQRIDTTQNSIFYSLIKKNDEIIAFWRTMEPPKGGVVVRLNSGVEE